MKQILYSLLFCFPIISWAADTRVDIANFSQGELNSWNAQSFAAETIYELEEQPNGKFVLRADSDASATVLYRMVDIDLHQTPILNWSWKVKNILEDVDERSRSGDDYAARVIIVFSVGLAFWRTRVISYVWSSNQLVGDNWPNAFIDNVRVMAVASGSEQAGKWIHMQRDVRTDYQDLFGEEIDKIDAVAIMTDTDNSNTTTTAWYGDIWSTKE